MTIDSRSLLLGTALLVLAGGIGCLSVPQSSAETPSLVLDAERALARARQSDPVVDDVLDNAYGFVVFPRIASGPLGEGGTGLGVVFQRGDVLGYCEMTQTSVGVQLGELTYTEVICFEDKQSLLRFVIENRTSSPRTTSVSREASIGRYAAYRGGVCVFRMNASGLMFESSLSGQDFNYQDVLTVDASERNSS